MVNRLEEGIQGVLLNLPADYELQCPSGQDAVGFLLGP